MTTSHFSGKLLPPPAAPTPTQQLFMSRTEGEGLMVTGPRGGRTTALLMDAARLLALPDTEVLFGAPDIWHILGGAGMARQLGRYLEGTEQQWEWHDANMQWRCRETRSVAHFATLFTRDDADRMRGMEFQAIYLDNIDSFEWRPQFNPYTLLLRCLTAGPAVERPRMRSTMCYNSSLTDEVRSRFVRADAERALLAPGEVLYVNRGRSRDEQDSFYYFIGHAQAITDGETA